MNFHIKENVNPLYSTEFREYVEYVNEGDLFIREICERIGITRNTAYRFRRLAIRHGLIPESRYSRNMCNIYYNPAHDNYQIRRTIDGEIIHYGTYPILEDATYVRDKLKENNWDKNKLPLIKRSLMEDKRTW